MFMNFFKKLHICLSLIKMDSHCVYPFGLKIERSLAHKVIQMVHANHYANSKYPRHMCIVTVDKTQTVLKVRVKKTRRFCTNKKSLWAFLGGMFVRFHVF